MDNGEAAQCATLAERDSSVQLDGLWRAGRLGSGSRVAVIDTGRCADRPMMRRPDFTVPGGQAWDLTPNRHGSTVMALIRRYAPMATVLGAKVASEASSVNSYLTMRALEWCWKAGANIVNLSMGFPIDGCLDGSCLLCHLVAHVTGRGVVVVAAGRQSPRDRGGMTIRCPAISEYAFTVGAIRRDGRTS